jgi:UDP-N-acetyl-D-mannosaminuronate dehydrogenase
MTPFKRIYQALRGMGASISIYDPMFKGEDVFGAKVLPKLEDAVRNVDCIIIGTAHNEIKNLNLKEILKSSNKPTALVDTQNIINPSIATQIGFSYLGVGRRPKN